MFGIAEKKSNIFSVTIPRTEKLKNSKEIPSCGFATVTDIFLALLKKCRTIFSVTILRTEKTQKEMFSCGFGIVTEKMFGIAEKNQTFFQ